VRWRLLKGVVEEGLNERRADDETRCRIKWPRKRVPLLLRRIG